MKRFGLKYTPSSTKTFVSSRMVFKAASRAVSPSTLASLAASIDSTPPQSSLVGLQRRQQLGPRLSWPSTYLKAVLA